MLLRSNNVFSTEDAAYAILETGGQLAVLQKTSRKFVSKKDIHIATE